MNIQMRSQLEGFICFVVVATCVQASFATQSGQESDTKTLTLSGVVVDSDGEPVENPRIELIRFRGRGSLERQLKHLVVTEKPDGTFRITRLVAGCQPVFRITDAAKNRVRIFYLDENDKIKSQPDLANLKFQLEEGSKVRGKVLLNGKPYPKVKISMNVAFGRSVAADSRLTYECQIRYGTDTDEQGEYLFENVPPGQFLSVRAESPNNGHVSKGSISAKAGEDRYIDDIGFESLNKTISGIVVDPQGKPIAGATLNILITGNGRQFRVEPTHKDGRFAASKLPAGKLSLWANLPRSGDRRTPSSHIEIVSGEKDIKVVLDDRLGREVKKRK